METDNNDTRIIVCDDEADIRDTLQEYLSLRGFDAHASVDLVNWAPGICRACGYNGGRQCGRDRHA